MRRDLDRGRRAVDFDPGYGVSPFAQLCEAVPGTSVYTTKKFRTEWGPIFHRGRLDGTARVLVVGQDPAAHEAIARRILCGEAGHRVQGFLWRLGIERSYVMINAFAYSVYGKRPAPPTRAMLRDRYDWIDAILTTSTIEAVVTFGTIATACWTGYVTTRQPPSAPTHAGATHPTAPVAESTLLANWNRALQTLYPAISHRDRSTSLRLYGSALANSDRREIPRRDFPPGLPAWMTGATEWATRGNATDAAPKASRITVTIPANARPVR
jgi:uracil-DNA glycosylase